MKRDVALVERVARNIPPFKNIFEDHVKFYEELLPHILFGEITPVAIDFESGSNQEKEYLRTFLDILEEELLFDDQESRDVIALSFLENLQGRGHLKKMKKLMGPRLRTLAAQTCGLK
jgi:hypothetical protein